MPNFMMLQQLQVLQQPSKHRPIYEKLRKIGYFYIHIQLHYICFGGNLLNFLLFNTYMTDPLTNWQTNWWTNQRTNRRTACLHLHQCNSCVIRPMCTDILDTELNRLALKSSSIKTKLSIHYKLKIHGIYTKNYCVYIIIYIRVNRSSMKWR